jgi:precorrin-3B C17-methyltransferase
MSGRVSVVGLGPGAREWRAPAVDDRLAVATDLVGYQPYLAMVDEVVSATRHGSDNRVEAERARLALDLAAAGRDVVVVSSGDPGVFAMASAVVEQLDQFPDRWREVDVDVLPGISAALALASRVGAPLGHDFCVISLSDVLKPWTVIERRLDAAARADFVLALYNPRSRHRPHQFGDALALIGRHREPSTPVVIGRRVSQADEMIDVVELAAVDVESVDMNTVVLVGSSATRIVNRPRSSSVYTPRRAVSP